MPFRRLARPRRTTASPHGVAVSLQQSAGGDALPTHPNPVGRDLTRLARAGIPRGYVRNFVHPDWWADEVAATPSGLAEYHLMLAECLGVELASLRDPSSPVRLAEPPDFKLKLTSGTSPADVAVTVALVGQIAKLAEVAARHLPPARLEDAAGVREGLLAEGAPWPGLRELARWCWQSGIVVLHVSGLPKSLKKMHGIAALVRGRPVIMLCHGRRGSAWQLFVLAHELGHLALGHVEEGGALLDERVDEANRIDDEEAAANRFAVELLCGDEATGFTATGRWPNAPALAREAQRIGSANAIDPGHVVLNYAHSMGGGEFFAVANAALRRLEPNADAPGFLRRELADQLDWNQLPADAAAYLLRVRSAG